MCDEEAGVFREREVKFFSSKRRVAAVILILLALFLVRPGASRLKSRIIYSISAGVGRPVDIGSVHIQLLPRPGFDLENLVVYDDPSFGAEPILRASEVTAVLRLTSLVRGRLEIARLDLTEPSLNLARREGGHWNVETLLEHTARIPLAPTGKAKLEPRPGFPYIEGTSGRINFKNGPEKTPYALTNADFSLWQESENEWGVRLKAQPLRTDMGLNDTGLLQLSGTWHRAEEIRDTPLQFSIEWSRAQVGQLTKLVTGRDQGWRGDLQVEVTIKGTPANLQLATTVAVEDFRRYDITSGKALRMVMNCAGEYSAQEHGFRQIICNAPVGDGLITLTGDTGLPSSHRYSIVMTAEKVPAGGLILLAQRVKKNLPEDLAADGSVQAHLSIQSYGSSSPQVRWDGRGEISDLHLSSATNKAEFGAETLPFVIFNDSAAPGTTRKTSASNKLANPLPDGVRVELGPVAVGAVHSGNGSVRGRIDRSGYKFTLTGDADIAKTLRLARMVGLPALATNAEGSAQADLQIAGNWFAPGNANGHFAVPQITGTARLHNVQIAARNAGAPMEIISADMQLLPDAVHVVRLNAKAAGTSWTGSLDLPRGCGTPDACPVHFVLNSNHVTLRDVQEWINPGAKKRPWYRVLGPSSDTHPAWLTGLRATGHISVDRFQVQAVEATHASANVNLENGKLQFAALNADLLDGKHRGEWKVDFSKKPAICVGSGNFSDVSLAAISNAMNDEWVAGIANASYELKGTWPADFWQSVEGKMHVEIRDGLFPHVLIGDGTQPLQARHINGQARLHNGEIEITDTELVSPEGTYQLSGTASLNREVDLKLTRIPNSPTSVGYSIGGTLEAPRVAPLSGTEQARLK